MSPQRKHSIIAAFLDMPLANKIATFTALTTFLCSAILITISFLNEHRLIDHSSELFGESLTKQLAMDASNPLVQGDNLSLQSLLNELVESPLVIHGAIYDVTNKPLAEAGALHSSAQSLSASVTFQDSIAGYAVVTLDTSPLQQHATVLGWQLFILAVLLTGVAYLLSLYAARYLSSTIRDLTVIASIPIDQRNPNTTVKYTGRDELSDLAKQIITAPVTVQKPSHNKKVGRSVVAIQLPNVSHLQAQHDEQEIAQLRADFDQKLALICPLYDGESVRSGSNNVFIYFTSKDNEQSYPFRAICTALLILQWQLHHDSAMTLSIGITIDTRSVNQPVEREALSQKAIDIACGENQLVADATTCAHSSVVNRIIASANSAQPDDNKVIEKLLPPYDKLLEKQLIALQTELD